MQRLKAFGLRLLAVWRKKIQNSKDGKEENMDFEDSGEKTKTKKQKQRIQLHDAAAKALAAVKSGILRTKMGFYSRSHSIPWEWRKCKYT